ncbi:MAG: IPT/TIG domain-containing protein [Candidatus Magasanikbacteria bacterium]|nr:IPT/TIG domain-containing protein [Candidatus Magasanikbacteria bacterium]
MAILRFVVFTLVSSLALFSFSPRVFAAAAPTVTSISPSLGPTAGGTNVTIGGTGFAAGTVTIGGASATNVTVVSATQITATTPSGTAGAQNVVFTRTSDGKSGTLTGGFTYMAPLTLTYTAGAHGSITGTSPQTVNYGDNGTAVTAVADAGYYFVNWSDTSTSNPRTDTNVTANISVTANFAITPTAAPTAPTAPIVQKTVINFFGRAYPGAVITLLSKTGSQETPVQQAKITSADGFFSMKIEGVFSGYYSYGLKVVDKDGRVAPVRFYDMDINIYSVNEKEIFIPPTFGLAKQTVFTGDEAVLLGYATPKNEVMVEVDGKSLENFAMADNSGFYRLAINTQNLSLGSHTVRVRQSDTYLGRMSDWSISSSFIISTSAKIKADFNNDGKVNIIDWSIFLFRWGSRDQKLRATVDLDGNGKINVIDLSIFLKTIQL